MSSGEFRRPAMLPEAGGNISGRRRFRQAGGSASRCPWSTRPCIAGSVDDVIDAALESITAVTVTETGCDEDLFGGGIETDARFTDHEVYFALGNRKWT
jgi:hypothetical protein